MKKIGNDIVHILGGREIHPINVRVGGFYRLPARERAAPAAGAPEVGAATGRIETAKLVVHVRVPGFRDGLRIRVAPSPDEYPMFEGTDRLEQRASGHRGPRIRVPFRGAAHPAFERAARLREGERATTTSGPLARFNLNFDTLSPTAQAGGPGRRACPRRQEPVQEHHRPEHRDDLRVRRSDPHHRAVRAAANARRSTSSRKQASGSARARRRAGCSTTGTASTTTGSILDAKIVPPTAQNQPTIEDDVRKFVTKFMDLPREQLTWKCEQAVRNYDPCISCATHFVKLEIRWLKCTSAGEVYRASSSRVVRPGDGRGARSGRGGE